jgi:hypothetical protein
MCLIQQTIPGIYIYTMGIWYQQQWVSVEWIMMGFNQQERWFHWILMGFDSQEQGG